METLLPEAVVASLIQMIEIEQRVLCDSLVNCNDKPDILVKVIFQRLSNNAMSLGNLSLVLSCMKQQVEAEVQMVEEKLEEADE